MKNQIKNRGTSRTNNETENRGEAAITTKNFGQQARKDTIMPYVKIVVATLATLALLGCSKNTATEDGNVLRFSVEPEGNGPTPSSICSDFGVTIEQVVTNGADLTVSPLYMYGMAEGAGCIVEFNSAETPEFYAGTWQVTNIDSPPQTVAYLAAPHSAALPKTRIAVAD